MHFRNSLIVFCTLLVASTFAAVPYYLDGTKFLVINPLKLPNFFQVESEPNERYDMGGTQQFYVEVFVENAVPDSSGNPAAFGLFAGSYDNGNAVSFGLGVPSGSKLSGSRTNKSTGSVVTVTYNSGAVNFTGVHTFAYNFNGNLSDLIP